MPYPSASFPAGFSRGWCWHAQLGDSEPDVTEHHRGYDPPMQHRESGFTAQYDSGTCTNCRSPIEAGQEIANSGYGGEVTRYHHAPFCPGAHITCSICGQNWYECDCP